MFKTDFNIYKSIFYKSIAFVILFAASCTNPFAPKLQDELGKEQTDLGDQRTVEGVFKNIRYSYTYKDTSIYGSLLHQEFQFRYYNTEQATDAVFNRDEEMRINYNLFRNADQLDIQWNDIQSQEGDTSFIDVTRAYNLKLILQQGEVFRVDGRARLRLTRKNQTEKWLIKIWYDVSNS
ncbi:MAG: hypothetical protein IPP08_11125 [Chlorobiota bacterium]|jgi:hypothetical protein|nr:hypothetical protein [Chlorobiota bacterium]QQS66305.1 MAG: hypothetical protein IPP08_11125 [Chlorobiota bacterium]